MNPSPPVIQCTLFFLQCQKILKIYEQYNGTTITFPKKLYSKGFVQKYICENYGVQSIQEISRYLNLSSRRVMQIAKEEGVTKAKTNAQEEIY